MQTDAKLVMLARSGEVSAYETLVNRWSARVCAYTAGRVRHLHVSEELAQEAFLKAFRSLDRLQSPDRFGSWLLSIAHRLCLDWLKAKSRSEVGMGNLDRADGDGNEPVQIADEARTPDEICDRQEQSGNLNRAIQDLPEELREVLMIYYYDEVTYREIAEMLDVSVGTVNIRLSKARSILRQQLLGLGERS